MRIVVIDDELAPLRATIMQLTTLLAIRGQDVFVEFTDPRRARQYVNEHWTTIDLIVVDLDMAGLTGLDLIIPWKQRRDEYCRGLDEIARNAFGRYPKPYLIALTGKWKPSSPVPEEVEGRLGAVPLNADAYTQKGTMPGAPFSFPDAVMVWEALRQQAGQIAGDELWSFGGSVNAKLCVSYATRRGYTIADTCAVDAGSSSPVVQLPPLLKVALTVLLKSFNGCISDLETASSGYMYAVGRADNTSEGYCAENPAQLWYRLRTALANAIVEAQLADDVEQGRRIVDQSIFSVGRDGIVRRLVSRQP